MTITGQGAFDDEGRSRMVLTVPRSESAGSVELEVLGDGTVMYMRSSMFGSLPEGNQWMALDFSAGGELDMPVPSDGDARGELELLEEAADHVEKLGKEDVRGVSTTRYRGTLEPAEQDGSPMQVEVWIDADGLVRRMRLVQVQSREGEDGTTRMDLRTDFFDFGIEPTIEVPESDEVFDATAMAQAQLR